MYVPQNKPEACVCVCVCVCVLVIGILSSLSSSLIVCKEICVEKEKVAAYVYNLYTQGNLMTLNLFNLFFFSLNIDTCIVIHWNIYALSKTFKIDQEILRQIIKRIRLISF